LRTSLEKGNSAAKKKEFAAKLESAPERSIWLKPSDFSPTRDGGKKKKKSCQEKICQAPRERESILYREKPGRALPEKNPSFSGGKKRKSRVNPLVSREMLN